MNTQTMIRFIQEDEVDELLLLCKEHANYEKSEFSFEGKKKSLSDNLFCEPPLLYCLVVQHNSKLIGYATYMKQFSTWDAKYYIYMDCLFLNKSSRGLSFGEQLIHTIKEEAVKLECDLMQWQTPTFNTGAIKFYNRIGAVSKNKERFFLNF